LPARGCLLHPDSGLAAANAGIKFEAFALRLAGAADFAVREDAVRHVKPAVGAPGEAVHELVRVLAAETGEHDAPGVRFVVAVGIAEVDEVRLLADVDAVIAADDGAGEIEALDEDGALVGLAVVVGVFEDDDAVAGDSFRQAFGIGWY
jgi:hypothetical protein